MTRDQALSREHARLMEGKARAGRAISKFTVALLDCKYGQCNQQMWLDSITFWSSLLAHYERKLKKLEAVWTPNSPPDGMT